MTTTFNTIKAVFFVIVVVSVLSPFVFSPCLSEEVTVASVDFNVTGNVTYPQCPNGRDDGHLKFEAGSGSYLAWKSGNSILSTVNTVELWLKRNVSRAFPIFTQWITSPSTPGLMCGRTLGITEQNTIELRAWGDCINMFNEREPNYQFHRMTFTSTCTTESQEWVHLIVTVTSDGNWRIFLNGKVAEESTAPMSSGYSVSWNNALSFAASNGAIVYNAPVQQVMMGQASGTIKTIIAAGEIDRVTLQPLTFAAGLIDELRLFAAVSTNVMASRHYRGDLIGVDAGSAGVRMYISFSDQMGVEVSDYGFGHIWQIQGPQTGFKWVDSPSLSFCRSASYLLNNQGNVYLSSDLIVNTDQYVRAFYASKAATMPVIPVIPTRSNSSPGQFDKSHRILKLIAIISLSLLMLF